MLEEMTGVWKEVDTFVQNQYIPIHMMVEVSRKCNINCVHCYNIKDREHLSLEDLDRVFAQLREAGTLFITLTGGEFFARTDACEILYMARDYGFDIRMITNGTLITPEKAAVMADVSLSEVGVSVLGATEETHDKIARVPGSFKRCIQGIRNCKAAGVPVHLKCTLMNENINEYKQVMELAKELGIIYMMDPVVTPRDDGDAQNVEKHRLTTQLLENFYMEHFEEMIHDAPQSTPKEKGIPCDAGTGFGAISADGSIYPCIQLPKAVGNIKKDNFKDVWQNSPILHKLRNVRPDQLGGCSNCSGSCNHCAGLAYLETGDMFGPTSTGCFVGHTYNKYKAQKEGKEYEPQSCGINCTCH